jgi:hypothetical protein
MLGDYLIQFTPRDLASPGIDLVHAKAEVTGNPGLSTAVYAYTVPDGKLLWLQNACAKAIPSAGLTAKRLEIAAFLHGTEYIFLSGLTFAGVSEQPSLWGPGAAILLEPGAQIRALCAWDVGNAANTLQINLFGYLIPRGNVLPG